MRESYQDLSIEAIPSEMRGEILYGDELLQCGEDLETLLNAVFFGSVDPFQRGHKTLCIEGQNEYREASGANLVIAIVKSFYKTHFTGNPPMFSLEERAHLIRRGYPDLREMPIVLCKPAGVKDESIGPRDKTMNGVIQAYDRNQKSGDSDNRLSQIKGAVDVDEVVAHMLDVYAKESSTQLSLLEANKPLVNALKTWVTVRWMKCRSGYIIKGVRAKGNDFFDFINNEDHRHTLDLFEKYLLPEEVQYNFKEYPAEIDMVGISSREVKRLVRSGRLDKAARISSEPVALAVSQRIHEIIDSGEKLSDFVISNGGFQNGRKYLQQTGRNILGRVRRLTSGGALSL